MGLALTTEVRGRVAVLTLNRPDRLNAIGTETLDLLGAAVQTLRADDRVRALVLAGAGRAFSAGADLGEIESVSVLFGTADRAEGLTAFRDRRPADFAGR